jgi:hypothetical protein
MEELRALADDKNIRDARKLYQFARGQGKEITMKQAAEALRNSTSRQLLAPPTRYQGHFASSGPGDQIQLDLIDWGARNKKKGPQFDLVGSDVYTRKLAVEPLKNKSAQEVYNQTADILEQLHAKDNAVITTDAGKEWSQVSREYSDHVIHRTGDVRDANKTAVVDAGIKAIKRDLASEVGKEKGRRRADFIDKVVDDLNEKPNPAVFGPPNKVTENPIQQFKVLQRNANNFALDNKNAKRMMDQVHDAGAFKAPADNGGRSFKPTFGPTIPLEGMNSQYVWGKGHLASIMRGEGGHAHEYLLKQVRPAYGNGKFESTLTTDPKNTKFNAKAQNLLKNQALQLENLILKEGSVPADDLLKKITGLKKLVNKYKNLTETNWIEKTFKKKFVVESGQVKLRPPKVKPPEAPAQTYSSARTGEKQGLASIIFFAAQQAKRAASKAARSSGSG